MVNVFVKEGGLFLRGYARSYSNRRAEGSKEG
jgi:hypothetical protein